MQQRTRTVTVGAVGVMALSLSLTVACAGSSSTSSGSTSTAASAGTVLIGFQGPLTGPNSAQFGINGVDGVKLAIKQANDAKSLPYTLRLDESDDRGDPAQGRAAAKKLVGDDVLAVIGPMFSGDTKAAEPFFTQAGILSVSPSATDPALTTLGFKTFYRVVSPDSVQGKAAADFIAKVLKSTSVFSLDDDSVYGTGLAAALDTELAADGVKVTRDGIKPTKDYTAEAARIVGAKPDAVYYSGYYAQFGPLVKALRSQGYRGRLLSGDGSDDPLLVSSAGAAGAQGVYLTCACRDANTDPSAKSFVAAYQALNGANPGAYSGEAYDAMNALISVLKGLGAHPTAAEVVSAFGKVDYQGLTKTVAFDSRHEIEGDAVYVYQVRSGRIVALGLESELVG